MEYIRFDNQQCKCFPYTISTDCFFPTTMKTHTTNYNNTFIAVAPDSKATKGEIPPLRNNAPTAASIQFELISRHPYKYTSDDVLFMVHATKNDMPTREWPAEKEMFFSKGQPCFRASPLTKRYGWGIHNNEEGKIAIVGRETGAYDDFINDKKLNVVSAMRSAR